MKKLHIITFLSFLGLTLNAQTNLDSLWSVWNDKTQPDTTRLKTIHTIAWDGYIYSRPDSAFYFAQMEYGLAEKSGLKKYMAGALNTQGISFLIRGDYPKALGYFQRSLKIKEDIGDKRGIAGVLNNIGGIYQNQGDYLKALDLYQRGLKISEEIGDKNAIATSLGNIGVIYNKQSDYSKAHDYYQRSLKIHEELSDKRGIAGALGNIGINYDKQGDYSKALDFYQRSLKIQEEMGNKIGIANTLSNIGLIYQNQGEFPKSLDYYQRSLKIWEGFDDKNGIALCLINMGILYQKQHDHQKAIDQCRAGMLLAQEIKAISLERDACKCLYDTYKVSGNGNNALKYLEQMQMLDDSLNAEETSKKLQQMEFAKQLFTDSIEQAEKDRLLQEAHEIEVAKKNKTRNVLIGSGLLALLFAGSFYSRWRYVKKSRDVISKERDRSENLLLNILPAEIAEELKEKGRADAQDFEMVSILFSDFKGFTAASEKLSAQDLVTEINTCFEAFDGIMSKYGIEKIKTIGDAYMAAGGLPVPTDDSIKKTVLAALEMQAFISKRKAELDASGKTAFEMRVGIHTGPVVAGIVGVKKFQYDIWGDTVNTASRMESSGEVGKVNISQATYEMLKHDSDFIFESRGKIEAKGKGEKEMYFVSKA
ncbi:MAG: tetratricopeptide repeat protein [Flavobacteriales bacterium]|nr:tetratricopeptide repeat protein [Flavobacteriales bacterium]